MEIFLGLLVQSLAELRHIENERREQVLKHSENFFNACVDEDGSNKCLKDVTHDFARLENFDLAIVHLEVFFERIKNVAVQVIFLIKLLL